MAAIDWRGPAPPAPVREGFKRAKIELRQASEHTAETPIVVFTASDRMPAVRDRRWIWLCDRLVDDAVGVDAVLRGAYAVISMRSPDAVTDLLARIQELLFPEPVLQPPAHIVVESAASQRVLARIARVAPTSMSVLLTGETGTGKEVMARLIHAWSARERKPFIPINCAAIPNELMEAELFGYARGAFSGAVQKYDGQLMAAEGGTVFLDEIDDTPLETQVKLLRVLEDHVVNRLGENVWHAVDFRLLAATNRDLRPLIDAGLFGADLYARLAIATIHLAPLRDRPEDLPSLARHFAVRFAAEQQRPAVDITSQALRALTAYPWPGNIRELRNVIYETLVYKRSGTSILLADLPRRVLRRGTERRLSLDRSALGAKIDRGVMNLKDEVAALERVAIEEALRRSGGNAAQAARLLGQVGRGAARDPGGTLRAMIRRLAASGKSRT